uniref:peptide-methionine (S)-S-oxide reductase n=1 Tax=Araucaria cunninghamii TaxID=56994 RepID=A0A0D6R015_ARACU
MTALSAAQVVSLATASYAIVTRSHLPNSRQIALQPLASNWASLNFSTSRKKFTTKALSSSNNLMEGLLSKLGIRRAAAVSQNNEAGASIAQGPDDDTPVAGQQFAQFGAGCFWGVELTFQRVPGVTKTEVGYTQGFLHNPTYEDVCSGRTMHNEAVRVQYDPSQCSYDTLLDTFWARHDPTTLNRQGNDVGTQYRSGIYFYTTEQEKAARESLERQEQKLNKKIVTEILPAKKFYRAEEYHQQYLEKGGRSGFRQSAAKGCNDPIRCYG